MTVSHVPGSVESTSAISTLLLHVGTQASDDERIKLDTRSAMQKTFSGHRHYVQGVAWDPLGECILTQSTDRTMRVLRSSVGAKQRSKAGQTDLAAAALFTQAHVVYKHVVAEPAVSEATAKPSTGAAEPRAAAMDASENCAAPANAAQVAIATPSVEAAAPAQPRGVTPSPPAAATATQSAATEDGAVGATTEGAAAGYIFQDESLNTFFRRLAFSPEGSFVVAPAASLGPLAPSSRCARKSTHALHQHVPGCSGDAHLRLRSL